MPASQPFPKSAELARLPLFEGIPEDHLPRVLSCLDAHCVAFGCGEPLTLGGEDGFRVRYLYSGEAFVERSSLEGVRSILGVLPRGYLFSNENATHSLSSKGISFVAGEVCVVIDLSLAEHAQLHECCLKHVSRLRANVVALLMDANLMLLDRLHILSERTIRGKLIAFLEQTSASEGSRTFRVPYTQQELADYLYVDRSALARELSKMRQEGILSSEGSMVTLLW